MQFVKDHKPLFLEVIIYPEAQDDKLKPQKYPLMRIVGSSQDVLNNHPALKINKSEVKDLDVYGMGAKLEHDVAGDSVGYFRSAKLFPDNTVRGYLEVTDPITRDRIRKGDLTHVSPNYIKGNYWDGRVSAPMFKEVSFVKNPYWNKCRITLKGSKNNDLKYINSNSTKKIKEMEGNKKQSTGEGWESMSPEERKRMYDNMKSKETQFSNYMKKIEMEKKQREQENIELANLRKEKAERLALEKKKKLEAVDKDWNEFFGKYADKDEAVRKEQKNRYAAIRLEKDGKTVNDMFNTFRNQISKLQADNKNLKKRDRTQMNGGNNDPNEFKNKASRTTVKQGNNSELDKKKFGEFNNSYGNYDMNNNTDITKQFSQFTGTAIGVEGSKKIPQTNADKYFGNKYGEEINNNGYSFTAFLPKGHNFSQNATPHVNQMKKKIENEMKRNSFLPWKQNNNNYF